MSSKEEKEEEVLEASNKKEHEIDDEDNNELTDADYEDFLPNTVSSIFDSVKHFAELAKKHPKPRKGKGLGKWKKKMVQAMRAYNGSKKEKEDAKMPAHTPGNAEDAEI